VSAGMIDPVAALIGASDVQRTAGVGLVPSAGRALTPDFAALITQGVGDLERKVERADRLAHAFVLDDSIPVHQVTFALEEARMSLDLMLQVRTRFVEAYQQLMAMQL